MGRLYSISLWLFLFAGTILGQDCGPSCPVCSGAGSSGAVLLAQRSMTISGLSIPGATEERAVLNARYGILSWLDAGVGYAIRTEEVLWSLRIQPVLEKDNSWRPGVIIGTGSVQTGGNDQSIYSQIIKSWEVGRKLGIQLSTGAATLLPDLDEVYGLAGATASFLERYAVFANYDGKSFTRA